METTIKLLVGAGILILVLLIGLYGFALTGNVVSNIGGKESLNIGIILPLSGNAAYYGEASQKGIEIAKKELEKEFPDLDINIYYGDSIYSPKEAISEYTRLRSIIDMDAIITAASHVSLAIKPLALEDELLQMAIFSSANKYSTPNDLSFRVSTRNEIEAEKIAEFIRENNYEKVGVIYLNNDFGAGFRDSLKTKFSEKNVSAEVVLSEGVLLSDKDFKTVLIKMKDKEVDSIFMVSIAAHYAQIMKQANELGMNVQFISMRSTEDPVLIKNAGSLANGLIYTYPFDYMSKDKNVKEFVDAFQSKYNQVPDAYSVEGYEGFKLVIFALKECNKDDTCIQKYLENLENYDSVFGPLSFDENGDVQYGFIIKTVKDGEFVVLE